MEPGPFVDGIMPVQSTVRWNDITHKWVVKVSRQVQFGTGARREITRQTFDVYIDALTYISHFWGND